MVRSYRYVGPDDILEKVTGEPAGCPVRAGRDLKEWLRETNQRPDRAGMIDVTFTVSLEGVLHVADRRSEHVACAGGEAVLSAGEMTFSTMGELRVTEVSNQSTGYCPEAESWPEVAAALQRAALPHPGKFTSEFVFRRCPQCGERNVVKERDFTCGICQAALPPYWNF